MAIIICEYCGKPFNNYAVKLCAPCSKIIEDSYIKARRYIYQNPKSSDFISIVEETEIPDKALSYLINKGRIEIANKSGGGLRCKACGRETSGPYCEQCKAKLMSAKLSEHAKPAGNEPSSSDVKAKSKILPISLKDE